MSASIRIPLLFLSFLLLSITLVSSETFNDVKIVEKNAKSPDIDCKQGKAAPGDTVHVHYTGRLYSNKKEFDSSVKRGTPFKFKLGARQVIAGWEIGIKGMCVGQKRTLIIPSKYGYGARGAGGAIPPNADLEFDVQLMAIGNGNPAGAETSGLTSNLPIVLIIGVFVAFSIYSMCGPSSATTNDTKRPKKSKK